MTELHSNPEMKVVSGIQGPERGSFVRPHGLDGHYLFIRITECIGFRSKYTFFPQTVISV